VVEIEADASARERRRRDESSEGEQKHDDDENGKDQNGPRLASACAQHGGPFHGFEFLMCTIVESVVSSGDPSVCVPFRIVNVMRTSSERRLGSSQLVSNLSP